MNLTQGMLIIYSSPTGEEPWTPVLPADVPDWVKGSDNLARMVGGEMAQKDGEALWYRAEEIKGPEPIEQAMLEAAGA